jgi:hypothetical protein
MARTAFNRLFGTTQGRIAPTGFAPTGSFAFVLGSDLPGVVGTFNTGDKAVLSQTFDTTGVKLVRFQACMRAPSTGPAWTFAWGVDGGISGQRALRPGKVVDMVDGVMDVSQLAPGNHTLQLTLQVSL